jgi:hypothetical protein
MADIFSDDIIEAFRGSGCPLCVVVAEAVRRWIDSFWREGVRAPAAVQAFREGGGFCERHCAVLVDVAAIPRGPIAIANVYAGLVEHDLDRLAQLAAQLQGSRARRARLERDAGCPACAAEADALERKTAFFVATLRGSAARERYASSDGLCYAHLATAFAHARDHELDVARFLVENWRERLLEARRQLAEFDRKRDHRYAAEPRGPEQSAWTDAMRLYTGLTPSAPRRR